MSYHVAQSVIQEAIGKKHSLYNLFTEIKGVERAVWLEIRPTIRNEGIKALYADSRYPDNPSSVGTIDDLQSPVRVLDYYAQRLQTYLVAPETGPYTFHMSCNHQCELWLSTDENPSSKKLLHFIPSYMSYDSWEQ